MIYENALEKIHGLLQFGSRPGLDRIFKLLHKIGDPQDKCKFVHVAGTNGKGSVCQMISSVLTEAGYKTGLFISPYITDFRERIQINGKMIPKEKLTSAVEYIYPFIEEMAANGDIITEFEFVNAIAFYYYYKENCDIVVLETGMGGLLDCTNTIPSPLCSVITPIDLDHTAVLGDTVQEITYQKCGIIKENSFTVIGEQTKEAITNQIIDDAVKKHNEFFLAEKCKVKVILSTLRGTAVKYKGREFNLPLVGLHQVNNLKTALTAIEVLKKKHFYDINITDIDFGISKAVNPARFELLCDNPVIVLDGAHNPNGMEAFSKSTEEYIKNRERILIMGMLRDKDIETSLDFIKGKFSTVITLTVDNPRSITGEDLALMCRDKFENVISAKSPKEAVDTALNIAKENNAAVMVCGSLYLAGEIRPIIMQAVGNE